MAEKETVNEPKQVIEPTPEAIEKEEVKSVEERVSELEESGGKPEPERELTYAEKRAQKEETERKEKLLSWAPKTETGKKVKAGKEKDLKKILLEDKRILEPEIVDSLIQLEHDLLLIGQAKGKFGGGKRRAWRQTQRKTKEGNILTFSAMAVVGDKDGFVGVGHGRAKETLPAREKAIRKAKLNIVKIERGCSHFDCSCNELHTVPHVVEGKSGSVRIKLMPAPQGTGLVAGDETKRILRLAGIKDVYTMTKGNIRTTFNLAKACMDALNKTSEKAK